MSATVQGWLIAIRPRTLAAAFAPVAVGTACAHAANSVAWPPALAALVAAILIQIGTNFVNDAADFSRGTDNDDRVGPTRAAQAGLLTISQLWRGAAAAFTIAALIGIYLIGCGGWPIALIGILSILAGIAYTAGPLPLAYLGIADIAVFVFFGFVAVCGTALVQVGSIPTHALWASLPVGALSTAMLTINNLRDRVGDRVAEKKTFAVRFGRRAAISQCLGLYVLAFATPLVSAAVNGSAILLLPLASAVLAMGPLTAIVRGEGATLTMALGHTARLLLVFSLLWTVALWLW